MLVPVHSEPIQGYRIHWADSILEAGIASEWTSFPSSSTDTLDAGYLAALEQAQPGDLSFRYGLLYYRDDGQPVARIALQVLNFTSRNFKFPKTTWKTLLAMIALRFRRFRVIMAGNLFSVGKPMIDCPDENHLPALLQATEIEARRLGYDLLLLKDLPEYWHESVFENAGYHPFEADLTMQLSLPASWNSFDEYLHALTKKYRQRAVKIRRSGALLERRWLTPAEVRTGANAINRLFRSVQEKQVVRMGIVDVCYFLALSTALGDRFRMLGYFLQDRLVGFASYIRHGDELEVHYIGMDYTVNATHQLYFNILLDGIEHAIRDRYAKLELGRTAREAKAVCGCRPHPFRDRFKTRNAGIQRLLNRMAASFTEDEGASWQIRHPFGESRK